MGKYGPVLDLAAVAQVLGFRSLDALERSMQRGHLQLPTLSLAHRRGKFMLAHDLARHLAAQSTEPGSEVSSTKVRGLRREGRS
jgi:hypothetical protein